MSAPKWTPGAWNVDELGCIWAPDQDRGVLVANARNSKVPSDSRPNGPQQEANAHLIAAAPEMYEALETLLWPYGQDEIADQPELQKAMAVLAKARGES